MIFFGCTYYPWSALANFPILQKIVLINPLVYARACAERWSRSFRISRVVAVLLALLVFDSLLLVIGLRQFRHKPVA